MSDELNNPAVPHDAALRPSKTRRSKKVKPDSTKVGVSRVIPPIKTQPLTPLPQSIAAQFLAHLSARGYEDVIYNLLPLQEDKRRPTVRAQMLPFMLQILGVTPESSNFPAVMAELTLVTLDLENGHIICSAAESRLPVLPFAGRNSLGSVGDLVVEQFLN